MDALARQLAELQTRFVDAVLSPMADGGHLLHLPAVALPPGWSLTVTPVWVVTPAGYPTVRPDCFFADGNLTLASGAEPANSARQQFEGALRRWFSWHPTTWDATHDGLSQYVRFVERRLSEVR